MVYKSGQIFLLFCHNTRVSDGQTDRQKFTSLDIPTVHAIGFLISCRELMSTIFWPKFGCHGNHPDSHEILYTIFEFADPENLLIVINSSISCTEL